MAAITDRTIKNGMIALERKTIDDLRGRLRGTILLPGVPGYNEARSLWNGIVDRRPALIARCTNVTDVIAAVNFGREQNLVIAIKGGGHNVTGNAMCGDGIVIDVIVERAWRFRSPRSYTLLPHMGVAVARVQEDATAFAGRDSAHAININGVWTAEDADRANHTAWVRDFFDAVMPYATGRASTRI